MCQPGDNKQGTAALWQASTVCMKQRLEVLHERLLHLEPNCSQWWRQHIPCRPAHLTFLMASCAVPGEDKEGTAALWQALTVCMKQRLEVLHERLLHQEYSCPAASSDAAKAVRADQPTSASKSVQPTEVLEDHPAAEDSSMADLDDEEEEDGSEGDSDEDADSDNGDEEPEEAPPEATLKEQTHEELTQLANGLIGLCMLNDMAKRWSAQDHVQRDVISGIGQVAQQCHSLILRYAEQSVRQKFLTSILSAAIIRQKMQAEELFLQRFTRSVEALFRTPAAPVIRGRAEKEGLSFSAAALQLLEGQEFWETAEVAQRWPQVVAGMLQASGIPPPPRTRVPAQNMI